MRDFPVILRVEIPDRLVVIEGIIPVDVAAARQSQQEIGKSVAVRSKLSRGAVTSRSTSGEAQRRRLITVGVRGIVLSPLPRESESSVGVACIAGIAEEEFSNSAAEVDVVRSFGLGEVRVEHYVRSRADAQVVSKQSARRDSADAVLRISLQHRRGWQRHCEPDLAGRLRLVQISVGRGIDKAGKRKLEIRQKCWRERAG